MIRAREFKGYLLRLSCYVLLLSTKIVNLKLKDGEAEVNTLHVVQIILNSTTVATVGSRSPGHDGTIGKDGSKSVASGLDVLDMLQLILHGIAVAPIG